MRLSNVGHIRFRWDMLYSNLLVENAHVSNPRLFNPKF